MPESVKFTQEEVDEIKNIQKSYHDIQQSFGHLGVIKLRLQQQLDDLDNNENNLSKKFKDSQELERKFLDKVTKKYGEGTLNPETGEFTPNKTS